MAAAKYIDMKTEKEIRKFIQDNRVVVPKDDAFMNDLIRQINLLPEPASFKEDSLAENLRIVRLIRAALKKRARRQALSMLVLMVLVLTLLLAASMLLPSESQSSVLDFIYTWKYALLGTSCLVTIAVALRKTDMFRI